MSDTVGGPADETSSEREPRRAWCDAGVGPARPDGWDLFDVMYTLRITSIDTMPHATIDLDNATHALAACFHTDGDALARPSLEVPVG